MPEPTPAPETFAPWRVRLHEIIFEADDRAGKIFDIALIAAILASVVRSRREDGRGWRK